MWYQFYLENIHFALNLFAALVFFAVSYLYFDAWMGRRSGKELLKALGFLLLSLSFVVYASLLETTLLPQTLFHGRVTEMLGAIIHLAGFVLIIISLLKDRLEPRPQTQGLTRENYTLPVFGFGFIPQVFSLTILAPFLALVTAFLYLRRAFWGLEHHLRFIALSFLALTVYEILSLATLLRSSGNVDLYNLVSAFGPIWVAQHLVLLAATLILGKWVFAYLLKQLQTQLMMIFSAAVLVIFLITTVTFTALLVNNLKQETLKQLETNTKVLDLVMQSRREQNLSDAQVLAQDTEIKKAISSKSTKVLSDSSQNFLTAKKLSSVVIVDENGQVLFRGEDPERIGDSLSGDSLVKRALLGQSSSSVVIHQGVVAPQLQIVSAVPIILDRKKNLGAVLVATAVGNEFIDNIKRVSGLEASIYGQDSLAASTLTLADNKTRAIGTKFSDPKIAGQVLKQGKPYLGEAQILNRSYFISLLPLRDINNDSVGMLAVGELQTGTLVAAGKSIELTFIVAALLLMLSILPAAVISRQIAYQLH